MTRLPSNRTFSVPCDPQCRQLEWLGFVSVATDRAAFYLDNLKLDVKREKKATEKCSHAHHHLPVYAIVARVAAFGADEVVGKRPYEMDWANRFQDDHPPLVDFENLDGWTVTTANSAASIVRTREQQLWDKYVAKFTYRATGAGPTYLITPREPLKITQPFDAVSLWVYGNNWSYAPNASTPMVSITAQIPRCAGTRGERAADHRGVGGVVPVQPAADPRADRDGQGRRELRGAGHCQRAEQGRPRAVLRQPGGLHRAVPPADLRATPGARDRDVPRPRQRDQHRAWQAAVPEPAGDDSAGQSRPGLHRRSWRRKGRVSSSRTRAATGRWRMC